MGAGSSRSKIRFRIPSGDPSVTSALTLCGRAHNASYATSVPSECATTTRVSGSISAASRDRAAARSAGSAR